MRRLRLALALLMLPAVPASAGEPTTNQSIDALLGDHVPYEQLFGQLQRAVAAHDAAAVAGLVHYPITVSRAGRTRVVRSPAAFVEDYATIVTPAIAAVIRSQDYATVLVNDQGVMLGQGEVWLAGICLDRSCHKVDVKVVTIQDGPS